GAASMTHASTPSRKLRGRLRNRSPPGTDLVNVFREETGRAREFVAERSLVRIPDGELEVVDTPRFLRPLVPFAAYEAPGAMAADRSGMFYVTSPNGARSSEGLYCMHEVAATAIHEAYPGHHLQMLTAQAQESPVRRVLWTPVTVEGGSLSGEELMAEEGSFASLEQRLFQRLHLLWRAIRIVLDVGLHTRGMTPVEATHYMADQLRHDRRPVVA